MNKILTVAVMLLGISSAINMNKDSYYKPLELAEKKSSLDSSEQTKFFLVDDFFNWVYCSIYPNCYGRVE